VDSGAWPITCTSELSLIPDLGDIRLGQLASRAAAGEKSVIEVVTRTLDNQKGISVVPGVMFNSAI
jgi:hypothetical protein